MDPAGLYRGIVRIFNELLQDLLGVSLRDSLWDPAGFAWGLFRIFLWIFSRSAMAPEIPGDPPGSFHGFIRISLAAY